ncbi:ATP-binding protein [Hufsiella ginkgonis]|uniref:ATP-binding protein n=1 Tax=Hufsiella ginkgonis TaxID=2695274 RepID=A0A7K1XUQ4_9SPHI|nr:ATP-binding protein [Hufsiella ginkgonis]MXV14714.1 ATP-binding protein [Hufsiella ginkgonis]
MIETRIAQLPDTDLYTLQLPSKSESLVTVENFIEKIKDRYSIDEDTYANILTCLSEAVINAVIHGNKEDPYKKVFMNLEVQHKKLIITIADEGPGFDYHNIPDPTDPENLEKLTGRGVFIIKQLADQCIFNGPGNELELHFKI